LRLDVSVSSDYYAFVSIPKPRLGVSPFWRGFVLQSVLLIHTWIVSRFHLKPRPTRRSGRGNFPLSKSRWSVRRLIRNADITSRVSTS